MKLHLRYYGDPILRQKAEPIPEITDEVRELASAMIQVMSKADGIGLAAPQVGVLLRMFVSLVAPDGEKGEIRYLEKPIVYLNSYVSEPSEEMSEMEEGCLSLPKLYIPVVRPVSIKLEAMDLEGNVINKRVEGFLARHIMHENDHLNGVLHIDRLKGKRRTLIEPALRLIKQKYSS